MAIMETKRNKKIAVLAVVLVLAIGGIIAVLLLNKKGQGKEELLKAQGFSEISSLEAGESTPQSVWDKIEEKESESLEAAKAAEATTQESQEASETQEASQEDEKAVSGKEQEGDASSSEETQESETAASEETKESLPASSEETVNATESASAAEQQKEPEKETKVDVGTGSAPDTRVIDFASLQAKKNAHIYAWVSVPGTNVDYPVLRHPTDDGFYLYHNLNGSSGYPGCIYTENWNSKDWTDPVTVLYGHDMRSTGTMFHQLHKFEKQNFFDKNQYIYIYTPEKTLKYWIFATYVHSNEHLLYNHNFGNKDEFDSFFNTVLSSAGGVNHVREGASISSDSKIICLSTCIKNKPENRYLIFGVLQ